MPNPDALAHAPAADDLAAASLLAGYFVAHAVWSVADGAAVLPVVAHESAAHRSLRRFLGAAGDAARRADAWLDDNPVGADRAALVVDGYADLDGIRRDALIARVVAFGPPRRSLFVVVPYRARARPGGFAVHPPRFGAFEAVAPDALPALGAAFFDGISAHLAAAPLWRAHFDERG